MKLLQVTSAGIGWVPLNDLPPELPVACNGGASAEPMVEDVLAMALAGGKRLFLALTRAKRG